MNKIVGTIFTVILLLPLSAFAQSELTQSLYNQLKENIEQSCSNSDYLNCVDSTGETCNKVTQEQLAKISKIIESRSQDIADGQIAQLLQEIKSARNTAFEENNIDINKANSCGKQFLVK